MADSRAVLLILFSIGLMLLALAGVAIVLVILVMRFAGRADGWAELARRYSAGDPPVGQEYDLQTVRVGKVRYRRSVRVIVASQGLWLSMQLKWARFAPIWVPWSDVHGVRQTSLYGRNAVRLSIGDPPAPAIVVYAGLFEAISPYLADGF